MSDTRVVTRTLRQLLALASLGALPSLLPAQNLLVNGGFETPATSGCVPLNAPGIWGVDGFTTAGAMSGVTPRTGSAMLRFTTTVYCANGGSSSDIGQLVDISGFATGTTFNASAWFNHAHASARNFGIAVRLFSGPISSTPSLPFLAQFDTTLRADADRATWEQLELSFTKPSGATHLSFFLQSFKSPTDVTFADDAWLEADVPSAPVPEPSSVLLLGAGLVGVAGSARARRRRGGTSPDR